MHKTAEIVEAKNYILSKTTAIPEIGIILGSGLGGLADEIENSVVIPYEDIPFSRNQMQWVTPMNWSLVN